MQILPLLACPVCSTLFTLSGNALACEQGHTFDRAREGYINLLRKKVPGDTREMLLARRDFFAQDYYRPLSDTLNELIRQHLPTSWGHEAPLHILDAGCGEGYYLGRLQTYLLEQSYRATCLGVDISKDAILLAAKRYREVSFVVANLREPLIVQDHMLQVILNIFAPRNSGEFARALVPGGLLLIAIPGPQHLQHLRESLHLLSIEENKQQNVIAQFSADFELIATQKVAYTLRLSRKETEQVVMMTPNYWHQSDETRQALASVEEMVTGVEFVCLVLRRY